MRQGRSERRGRQAKEPERTSREGCGCRRRACSGGSPRVPFQSPLPAFCPASRLAKPPGAGHLVGVIGRMERRFRADSTATIIIIAKRTSLKNRSRQRRHRGTSPVFMATFSPAKARMAETVVRRGSPGQRPEPAPTRTVKHSARRREMNVDEGAPMTLRNISRVENRRSLRRFLCRERWACGARKCAVTRTPRAGGFRGSGYP